MSCVLAFSERRVAVVSAVVLDAHATPEKSLDAERSRRFDAGSALAAAGAAQVLADSERDRVALPATDTGLVLGTAFGNVERTMAFLARGRERGPRHVPPAEFPHLVPSAPAGNASVYAGLTGPVFAVSSLSHSGAAAFAAACELIELGVAARVVTGAVAPRDVIVERVLGPLLDPSGFRAATRGQGAGFALLAERSEASRRGGVLAEVLGRFTGELTAGQGLDGVPQLEPAWRACVVLGVAGPELRQALESSSWARAARVDLAAEHGYHEALDAVAVAVAARLMAGGELDRVLVLSGSEQAFSASLLGRPGERE
jgi:3-oxoacyl-(acyl-carrier-protein) synthase